MNSSNGFINMAITVVLGLVIVGVVLVPIIDSAASGGGGGGGGGDDPAEVVYYNDLRTIYAGSDVDCDYKSYQVYDIGTSEATGELFGDGFKDITTLNMHWELDDLLELQDKFSIDASPEVMQTFGAVDGLVVWVQSNNFALEAKYITYDGPDGYVGWILLIRTGYDETAITFSNLTDFDLTFVNGDMSLSYEGTDSHTTDAVSDSVFFEADIVRGAYFLSDEENGWVRSQTNVGYDLGLDEYVVYDAEFGIGSVISISLYIDLIAPESQYNTYSVNVKTPATVTSIEDGWMEGDMTVEDYSYYAYGNARITGFDATVHYRIPVIEVSEGVYRFNYDYDPGEDDQEYSGSGYWEVTSWDYDYFYQGTLSEVDYVSAYYDEDHWVSTGNVNPVDGSSASTLVPASASRSVGGSEGGGMSNTLLAIVPVFLVLGILIYVVQYFRENKGF